MSLDQSPVAVRAAAESVAARAAAAAAHPSDPQDWWHETWSFRASAPSTSAVSLRSAQLPAWVQRVRAVVWPAACSRAL